MDPSASEMWPQLLKVGVEVEKAEGGMRAKTLAPHTEGWVS